MEQGTQQFKQDIPFLRKLLNLINRLQFSNEVRLEILVVVSFLLNFEIESAFVVFKHEAESHELKVGKEG